MQEEVENRTLTLVVSGTKFTGRLFKAAISKYMAHRREKKLEKQRSRDSPVTPKGKQTVKQLIGQNQGVSNIEINDPSIRDFERIARKYGVDYAVKKDRSTSPPKYLIFFKGRDADALTAAFSEYTQKKVKKADLSELLEDVKRWKDEGTDLHQCLDFMQMWYRDVLMYKTTKDVNLLIFKDEFSAVKAAGTVSGYDGLEKILNAIDKARVRLDANVNMELAMELMLLTMKEN